MRSCHEMVGSTSGPLALSQAVPRSAAASQHIGCTWLVKMDLLDFFHSIDERAVNAHFLALGYNRLVSFEMARVCTRIIPGRGATLADLGRYLVIPQYSHDHVGVLPQGAPSSGLLANRAAWELDNRLQEFSDSRQLVYTRYADDLCFSAASQFRRPTAASVVQEVRRTAERLGFRVNPAKTRIVPPGARPLILGLHVLEDRVGLPHEFRRRMDQIIHGVSKYGPVSYSDNHRFQGRAGFLNHVNGLIAYVQGIDPDLAATLKAEWEAALKHWGVELTSSV